MVPFSWRHWLCNLMGPARISRRRTNESACLMIAELLEDRLVPAPIVHNIYIVGTAGVTSSLHAGKPVFTDATRFNDGAGNAGAVEEIGSSTTWVAPNLRSAVAFANDSAGTNAILLETTAPAKPYLVNEGEIDFFQSSGTLSIKNAAKGISTIDAQHDNRIFADYGGAVVTLDHLKLTDGSAYGGDAEGAAIANFGTMNLTNDQFVDNQVSSGVNDEDNPEGGAIYNESAMTLSNDLFTGNEAYGGSVSSGPALGGALYNDSGASLSITNSNFTNNTALGGSDADSSAGVDAGGGAIYIQGDEGNTIAITDTTFASNNATGGAFSGGEGSATNGGSAFGGAIDCGNAGGEGAGATLNLTGCTFNRNFAATSPRAAPLMIPTAATPTAAAPMAALSTPISMPTSSTPPSPITAHAADSAKPTTTPASATAATPSAAPSTAASPATTKSTSSTTPSH
jgi:hypothetical protein